MHTENDIEHDSTDQITEAFDGSQEDTVRWLLEMDISEPNEGLFTLDEEDCPDTGLTDYEAAVAGRPMTRGRADADDFATYVTEEIVISSESQSGSIYTAAADPAEAEVAGADSGSSEPMAIDYSRRFGPRVVESANDLEDGKDVLELTVDDDIGEKFPVLKGVKPEAGEQDARRRAQPVINQAKVLKLANPPVAAPVVERAPLTAAHSHDDLSGVVAAVQPPVDEQEFDDYLAQLEQGPVGADDIDQLVFHNDDGPVHDDADGDIDYHEDFSVLAGFDGVSVAAITPRIPLLMEEITALVGKRLVELDLAAGSVRAEFRVGSDPEHVAQWLSAGFAPLASICPSPLTALQSLNQAQVEEIFVRLLYADSARCCNQLLSPDFVVPGTEAVPATGGDSEPPEDSRAEAAPVAAETPTVFEADLPAIGLDEGSSTADWQPADGDIDALFDSSGQFQQDDGEICGIDVEEFVGADNHGQADLVEAGDPAVDENIGELAEADLSWCIPEGIAFNHASQSSTEISADFLDVFIEEGASELEKLEEAIAAWETDIASTPALTAVARTLHTVKGIAKGVGLHFYGALIHNFETLLDELPRPEQGGEAEYFRIINAWLTAAVRGLEHIRNRRADVASEFPQRAPVPITAAAAETPTAPVVPVRADREPPALTAQQSVRITSDKLDHLLNLSNQAQQLGVRTAQSTARGKHAAAEMQGRLSSVRAHIASVAERALGSVSARGDQARSDLDALEMDQYSELQEVANILREAVEDLADMADFASRQNAQVEALLNQQATAISSIGSAIRAARVVPVSRLIPGLRRVIRTLSNDLGKPVSLRVLNELGTLDRDDYARCQIILDHMVRNALDHGLESSGERQAAGKPVAGQITIDIRKEGADAIITLADDGRGIDPERMRDTACRKGLNVEVDALTDDEAIRLIFHPGFSTASSVSQISGRGVGMDIVLSELQQMGGNVQIESTVGRGTAFHIRIPSSITVNGALLVTAGDQSYAIPLGGLVRIEQVPVSEFFEAVEHGTTLTLAGMECQPAYLATLCHGGVLPEKHGWNGTVPVIIAGTAARFMAIAIDDVKEALELEIRSLGVQFSTVAGVAGAATAADGEAIVALDLNQLVDSLDTDYLSPVCVAEGPDNALLAMVVDDSRTQRIVATGQLETVGIETITAENGAVAIDLLNSADRLPDIILLDIEMPVQDGIQTLREIRKSVRYGHVPVIMVTSRTGLKHRAMARSAGCNGYMGKPFNFPMLLGQINELTGHRLQLS